MTVLVKKEIGPLRSQTQYDMCQQYERVESWGIVYQELSCIFWVGDGQEMNNIQGKLLWGRSRGRSRPWRTNILLNHNKARRRTELDTAFESLFYLFGGLLMKRANESVLDKSKWSPLAICTLSQLARRVNFQHCGGNHVTPTYTWHVYLFVCDVCVLSEIVESWWGVQKEDLCSYSIRSELKQTTYHLPFHLESTAR